MNTSQKAAVKVFFGDLQEITTDQLYYHKDDKSFSQEASSLGISCGSKRDSFRVLNPKTNQFRIFTYSRTIYMGSGEDREVGSWEYKTQEGILLKIWND